MSKLKTNNAGRDQYNISGDGINLQVDNRDIGHTRSVVAEIIIGVIIIVIGGFLLYIFKLN